MSKEVIGRSETAAKWRVLATIAFGTFMATLDSSIVNIALPTIRKVLNTGDNVEWIVLSYLLITTSSLLIMGRLSDYVGRKNIYITGFSLFIFGSLLCGLSWSLSTLVASRVIQGLGASMIFAIGPAIISDTFQPNERGRALGLIGTVVAAGSSTGPVAGGLLLEYFGWQSIFFVNVPIGLIAIWRAIHLIPSSTPDTQPAFDLGGAFLFFFGITTLLVGVDLGADPDFGWQRPVTILLLAGAVVLLVAFIFWEKQHKAPMLNLMLFRTGPFASAVGAAGLAFVASGANIYVLPFYLQLVLQFSPQDAGFIMLAGPLTLSMAAPLGGYLSDKVDTRWIATAGLITASMGYFSLTFIQTHWAWQDIVWRIAAVSLGFGLFQSPNSSSALNAAPVNMRGIASSMIAFVRNLGLASGIAVAATVWYSVRHALVARSHENAVNIAQLEGMRAVYYVISGLLIIAAIISLTRRPVSNGEVNSSQL